MRFSVAIVTHNRPFRVDRLLSSLRTQTCRPDEVIVVNNGRNDRTTAVVRNYGASFADAGIDLYQHERDGTNLPDGRNVALEAATGDVICFLDDDTVPAKSWLNGIERGYEHNRGVVGVGGPSITHSHLASNRTRVRGISIDSTSTGKYVTPVGTGYRPIQ